MKSGKERSLRGRGAAVFLIALALGIGFFLGTLTARRHSEAAVIVTRSAAEAEQVSVREPVNLNTADAELLQTLPGIGPALAERILRYREENGPFSYPYEVTNISGIGESIYEKFRELVTVEP